MTGKERATRAIARESVDRVPLGFYAVDHDTVERVIGRPTYVRNKIEIQKALWDGRRAEVAEGLKKDSVEFYRKIDCADVILPKEAMLLPPEDYLPDAPEPIGDNLWRHRDGRVFQAVPEANDMMCVKDPTREAQIAAARRRHAGDRTEAAATAVEEPPDASIFEVLDHMIAELGEERYVAGVTGGITMLTLIGGTELGLMLCATDPDLVLAESRAQTARQNRLDRWYIRPGVSGVLMEQDTAGTNGPLVSPTMFRALCLPFLAERIAHVKRRVPQVIFHNCGHTIPLMDQFIEAGIDCYQSLQTTAGMEIGLLKERYGDELCFWGGVPVELLIGGTPDEVRKAVREAMQTGAPGGGFILGPSHSVATNTRYENFMAMLDEYDSLAERF